MLNQRGNSPIILIGVLAVVALIGVSLFVRHNNFNVQPEPSPTSYSKPTTTPLAAPTAIPSDWKRFTWKNAGISFQYPPDWKIIPYGDGPQFEGPDTPIPDDGRIGFILVSPEEFSLAFDYITPKNPLFSMRTYNNIRLHYVEPVIVNNNPAYIISWSNGIHITDKHTEIGDTAYSDCINITRANLCISGGFTDPVAHPETFQQIVSEPYFNEARLIMLSIKY